MMLRITLFSLLVAVFVGSSGCSDVEEQWTARLEASAVQPGACYSSEHCGPGTVCARFDETTNAGRCYRACTIADGEAACPGASVCAPISDGVATSASDEPAPDGACLDRSDASGAEWSICESSRDCGGLLICAHLPDTLGARCVQPCIQDADCVDGSCVVELQSNDGGSSYVCAELCGDDSECEDGESCSAIGASGLCVP